MIFSTSRPVLQARRLSCQLQGNRYATDALSWNLIDARQVGLR